MIKYHTFFLIFGIAFSETNSSFKINIDNHEYILVSDDNAGDNRNKKNQDRWIAIDKIQHFSYSCLIALGCQYVLVNKYNNSEDSSLPFSCLLSFSAGLAKELNDKRGQNGYFSIKDMIANIIGISVACLIILQE